MIRRFSIARIHATGLANPFLFVGGFVRDSEREESRRIMKITVMVALLSTIAVLNAVAQESAGEQIKQGAVKVGETVKDAAKTVGEKTKEAAKTVGEKTKELWRDTKAYASNDRKTYRNGARQKLNDLGEEIAELKNRKSEAADPQAFESQLDTLSQQHATAKEELAKLKKTDGTKDYAEARKQFDTTIDKLEDGIAQARKQLGG
jgi:G3E family GTPase